MEKRNVKLWSVGCALAFSCGVFAQEKTPEKIVEDKNVKGVEVKSEKISDEKKVSANLSLAEAFKTGKISGEIGSYIESTKYKNDKQDNFGWQTAYIGLKYETARWNNLKLVSHFWGFGKIFDRNTKKSNGDYGVGYKTDIEDSVALAELYLDWAITDKTNFVFGRFDHRKVSRFDDNQSEGFYFNSKELKNWEFSLGAMTRFAEIDYDDCEGFGFDNDLNSDTTTAKQDLSDDKFFPGAWNAVLFGEARYVNDAKTVKINPYFYTQPGYASVLGIDTDFNTNISDNVKAGIKLQGYNVFADTELKSGKKDYADALVFGIEPYLTLNKKLTFSVGFVDFDKGDESSVAMNRPTWFADYMVEFDQDRKYATENCSVYFTRLKYEHNDKLSGHIQYGIYRYGDDQNNECRETEVQATYKFTKELDLNVRLFNVDFANVSDNDYQKLEARLRYRF